MNITTPEKQITIESLRQKCQVFNLSSMKYTGSDSFILVNEIKNSKLAEIFDTTITFSDIEVQKEEEGDQW